MTQFKYKAAMIIGGTSGKGSVAVRLPLLDDLVVHLAGRSFEDISGIKSDQLSKGYF